MKITIYFTSDGKAVIRWPAGVIPDSATVAQVAEIINKEAAKRRKSHNDHD